MTTQQIIAEAAKEFNISYKVAYEAYYACFRFIRETLDALPQFNVDMPEEEFNNIKHSFNLKNLGKLCCNYDCYLSTRRHQKYMKENYYDKNKED